MAAEEKSESINFDNEQVEQRTLGSDEERQIKKQEENKTCTKSKEGSKSQSKFYKTKLPPIKKGKRGKQLYKGMPQPIISSHNNQVKNNTIDDEELYPEIKIVKKEIRNLNKELKNLKSEYYILEEQNLTYKYMIEKILKSKNRNQQNFNNENNNQNNDNTINEKNEEENSCAKEQTNEDEEVKNNDNHENENTKKKKSKKNKHKSDAEIKISVLKKQNYLYDNTLQQNNNKLEGLRKNEKSIQYQQLVSSINSKNDELEENLKKYDKLNQTLMEYETKIKYYMVKAQMFSNDNYKIDADMEENRKMIERFDEDLKDYNSKKDSLNKKINQLEEEIKDNKKRN